jgi:hypothetical protein
MLIVDDENYPTISRVPRDSRDRRLLSDVARLSQPDLVVRQALKREDTDCVQRHGLVTDTLIQRSAGAATLQPGTGRDEVEKTEVDPGVVHEQGEPLNLPLPVGRYQEDRPETILQGVAQPVRQLRDLVRRHEWKLFPEDALHLPESLLIRGDGIVVGPPDAKHALPLPSRWRRSTRAAGPSNRDSRSLECWEGRRAERTGPSESAGNDVDSQRRLLDGPRACSPGALPPGARQHGCHSARCRASNNPKMATNSQRRAVLPRHR